MQKSEYRNIYQNEEKHFFYRANHQLVISLLHRLTDEKSNLKILDAGCGTGLLAQKLQALGTVDAIDINPEAIKFAKKREVKVKLASITNLPFNNSSFDIVISIDVLYHQKVTNDNLALAEFYRVLKPGGLLIVRVPAYNWLLRSTDIHVHTRKRYNLDELKGKLRRAKFKIIKISYVNLILLPPAVASWFLEKLFPSKKTISPLVTLPSFLNQLVFYLLMLENLLLNFSNLPFGLGLIAVSKKSKALK